MVKKKIAVLGAGPMGLAVAYQLCLSGYSPTIFEADDRVGGMTAAFDFKGLNIERYYHFHCISDKAFLEILEELNLSHKMNWRVTKMGFMLNGVIQPWGNPIALLKFKGISLVAKLRYGLHAFFSTKKTNWKKLDSMEATSWIKKWVGNEAYEILWKTLIEYKFYDYSNNLSAAWIWSRIRRIGKSRYNLFEEKLGFLEGGSETLLQAMKKSIEINGGNFRFKSPATEVKISDSKIKGIIVNNKFEDFDKVICTIPLTYVPDLIPNLPADLLKQFSNLKSIAVVCVIAKLNIPLTENFWLNINDPEMDIPGVVEYTNLRKLDDHIVYIPFYMPGEHSKFLESDDVFKNKVKKYLKKINPQLKESNIIDIHASRYRYAQPICTPNFLANLPPANLPIEGLWVADTSYYYPEDRGISESIDFGRKMAKEAMSN